MTFGERVLAAGGPTWTSGKMYGGTQHFAPRINGWNASSVALIMREYLRGGSVEMIVPCSLIASIVRDTVYIGYSCGCECRSEREHVALRWPDSVRGAARRCTRLPFSIGAYNCIVRTAGR